MSLPTLPSVEKLQRALHTKAKESPSLRFYALYDKVYRADVLWTAWRRCLHNGGSAGVDGQTFEDIEQYGAQRWLDELAEELRSKPEPGHLREALPSPAGCSLSTDILFRRRGVNAYNVGSGRALLSCACSQTAAQV